jgi:hypothetical protein
MDDPNVVYKARFRELTELLGRAPVSSDAGWLAMHEEYKNGWMPAEETVLAPRVDDAIASAAGPVEMGFSREPAPQARVYESEERARGEGEPLSGPDKGSKAVPTVSVPSWCSGALRIAEGPTRGAGGGVLAVCERCGREWERERRRGRPAARCLSCR